MTLRPAFVLAALLSGLAASYAQPAREPTGGELLYTTHCITCHSDRMHWREKRSVSDWGSLRAQVRRWQAVAGLGWSEEDIGEVARYLNARYYHLPDPG